MANQHTLTIPLSQATERQLKAALAAKVAELDNAVARVESFSDELDANDAPAPADPETPADPEQPVDPNAPVQ